MVKAPEEPVSNGAALLGCSTLVVAPIVGGGLAHDFIAESVWVTAAGAVVGLLVWFICFVVAAVVIGPSSEKDSSEDTSEPPDPLAHLPPKPQPRMVRNVPESEELAAEWVQYMGWPTAHVTRATGDSGVDVLGHETKLGGVAVQVKFEANRAGRPVLQSLYGAGLSSGLEANHFMFFASAGYSRQAEEWADRNSVALFQWTFDGSITPLNETAQTYFEREHILSLER